MAQVTAMFTPPSDQVVALEARAAELRRRSEAAGWQEAHDETPATPMMDRWRLTRSGRVREIAFATRTAAGGDGVYSRP